MAAGCGGIGGIEVIKRNGINHEADALTTPLDGERIREHVEWVQGEILKGRHEIIPGVGQ